MNTHGLSLTQCLALNKNPGSVLLPLALLLAPLLPCSFPLGVLTWSHRSAGPGIVPVCVRNTSWEVTYVSFPIWLVFMATHSFPFGLHFPASLVLKDVLLLSVLFSFFPLRAAVPSHSCPPLAALLVRLFCTVFYSLPWLCPLFSSSSYKLFLQVPSLCVSVRTLSRSSVSLC